MKLANTLLLSLVLAACGGGGDEQAPEVITIGTGANQVSYPSAEHPNPISAWPPSRPFPGGASYSVTYAVTGKFPIDIALGLPAPQGLQGELVTTAYSRTFTATAGQSLYLSAASLERGPHSLGGAIASIYVNGFLIAASQAAGNTATVTLSPTCC